MDCNAARQLFDDFLNERLGHDNTDTINGHIAGCGSCQEALKHFRATGEIRYVEVAPEVERCDGAGSAAVSRSERRAVYEFIKTVLLMLFILGSLQLGFFFLYEIKAPAYRYTPVNYPWFHAESDAVTERSVSPGDKNT